MRWFKHISDSLDDPFIFGLMEEFGPSGYLVFFGVLEIYAREFSTKDDWKLTEKWSFFRHKLLISRKRFKKILLKIYKWEVEFDGDLITIFIPKFKGLMDESTLKKLRANEKFFRNRSGIVPKSGPTDVDVEVDVDIEEDKKKKKRKRRVVDYSSDFKKFIKAFGDNRGQAPAYEKSWCRIPDLDNKLVEKIIEGAKRYAIERERLLANGERIKMAQGWLTDRRWEDEISTEKDWKKEFLAKHEKGKE